jgi:GxxExxY protein
MRTNANTANTANKIVHSKLSFKLTGIAFKIQNEHGRFCTEKQYAAAFEEELGKADIKYEREKYLPVKIQEDSIIGKNWVDFVIEGIVAVDLKAKPFVERKDYYQMQRYLNLMNLKLGLIINFQSKYLKPKRILNSRYSQNS